MQRFRWRWLGPVVLGGLALSCGNALYVVHVARASDAVARAEQLGAATRAPYDYHYAVEHLRKARSEAAEADYGDAERLALAAYEHATRAVQMSRRVTPVGVGGTPQ
jgi:uncharacterized protein DUF4398